MQSQLLTKTEQNDSLGFWDWVLVVGITFSPMNELRIWKVGPGELLLLIWSLRYIKDIFSISTTNVLGRFWILFLPIIAAGAIFCRLFYPDESDVAGLLTYAYFAFVSIGIYSGARKMSAAHIRKLLKIIGIVVSCWFMFLYLYSRRHLTFLGASLWYRRVRYSGGANNPHQIAVTISSVVFINIIQVFDRKVPLLEKIPFGVCAVFCFIMAKATKSSTLVVAVVIALGLFIYYLIVRTLQTKRQRWVAFSVIVIIAALAVGIFRDYLYEMIYEWIADDPNGLERIDIFSSITITLRKNFLFGLGPGNHALDGYMEYHNSYLELLAMGGILGLTVFVFYSVNFFRGLLKDPAYIFVIAPVYFYGLAGFSMRRMIFWVMSAILVAYAERLAEETETEPEAQPDSGPPKGLRKPSFLRQAKERNP